MSALAEAIEAAILPGAPQAEAEALGRAVAGEPAVVLSLMPRLVHAPGGAAGLFAYALGQEAADPAALLAEARACLADGRPPGGPFVFSLLLGWHATRRDEAAGFLDAAARDPVWHDLFPALQVRVGVDAKGCRRLLRALADRALPAEACRPLAAVHAVGSLSAQDLAPLLDALAGRPDGAPVALDVLAAAVGAASARDEAARHALAEVAASFLARLDWSEIDVAYEERAEALVPALAFTVAEASDGALRPLLDALVALETDAPMGFSPSRGKLLEPFLRHRPRLAIETVVRPDPEGGYGTALRMLGRLVAGSALRPPEARVAEVLAWLATLHPAGDPALAGAVAEARGRLRGDAAG